MSKKHCGHCKHLTLRAGANLDEDWSVCKATHDIKIRPDSKICRLFEDRGYYLTRKDYRPSKGENDD